MDGLLLMSGAMSNPVLAGVIGKRADVSCRFQMGRRYPMETNGKAPSATLTALCRESDKRLQIFRIAQTVVAYRAAATVFAKMGGRLDQFFKIDGVGFNKALFL